MSVDYKHVLISRNCLALVLATTKSDLSEQNGHDIFLDFLRQNSMCFWNSCLSRSVSSLEYRGFLVPSTLLITGTDFSLEVMRSAWARRILRPPKGYIINKLGDISVLEMVAAPQTHFAPLSEALCKVVADLNGEFHIADPHAIRVQLEENFPEMQTPSEEILQKALNSLIREGKLRCTGNGGYSVSDKFCHERQSFERQMLMTNEEAIVKLHGNSSFLPASTQQTPSNLQMMDLRNEDYFDHASGEGKQQSVLTKILKKMRSSKQHVTFSAQFPPPDTLLYHSVATQTQKMYSPLKEPLKWGTHSAKNRRRHRPRTSSSESSKVAKSPAKFPTDKWESNISNGFSHYKSAHKSNSEKRHPKQYSKAPLTKQVERIQEVTSSLNNIPSLAEEVGKESPKNGPPASAVTDIVIDNTLSVETPPPKGNVSTTVVTEETTVTKGKIVTVTSITTSLSKARGLSSEAKKNDLNQKNAKISELVNSCNIVNQ